jgi:NADH-quinone oxidoreductase subunit K
MADSAAVPLSWYLILGAALFCVGVYGALSRRNLLWIMMSLELMLNSVILNLVAFARFLEPGRMTGKVFAIMIYAIAASETAIGLALVISVWRIERTVAVEEIDLLKG